MLYEWLQSPWEVGEGEGMSHNASILKYSWLGKLRFPVGGSSSMTTSYLIIFTIQELMYIFTTPAPQIINKVWPLRQIGVSLKSAVSL